VYFALPCPTSRGMAQASEQDEARSPQRTHDSRDYKPSTAMLC